MQATFRWNKKKIMDKVAGASERTLNRVGNYAHQWWLVIAPVGVNTKTHHAGQLRESWFAFVVKTRGGLKLVFGASAPYAIYVELGTGNMTPRAPIRKTAGEVFPFVVVFLREELAA